MFFGCRLELNPLRDEIAGGGACNLIASIESARRDSAVLEVRTLIAVEAIKMY
jgi:hypothetical protein